MTESNTRTRHVAASGGITFGGALAILFIGLKLGGAIDWSWLWVLSPLWLPVVIAFCIVLAVVLVALLVMALPSGKAGKRWIMW